VFASNVNRDFRGSRPVAAPAPTRSNAPAEAFNSATLPMSQVFQSEDAAAASRSAIWRS